MSERVSGCAGERVSECVCHPEARRPCHPERSEGSIIKILRGLRPLRMTVTAIYCFLTLCSPAHADGWKELKSEHFIVYYLDGDQFAADVSQASEKYYSRIASDLGYARYDNFWTWDNRAKIYLYSDRDGYLSTGAQKWSYGMSRYDKKEIVSYANSAKFVESILPHELAHLIFRDFVGFKSYVPVWLDEGVAQWEESDNRSAAVGLLKEYISKNEIIPLAMLMKMNIAQESNVEITRRFYVEAVTLVGFLIKEYGPAKFTLFCRGLRDGENIDDALRLAYSEPIVDSASLEREWLQYYGG